MRLLLISHAASGPELSEGARARAAEIGRMLPMPRRAFTSPATAARQTAAALGLEASIVDALAEDGDIATWLAEQERAQGTRAAVTHVAVIRAAVVVALGAPAAAAASIDVAPCSVTELAVREGGWHLARVNWEPALLHIPQRRGRRRPPRPG